MRINIDLFNISIIVTSILSFLVSLFFYQNVSPGYNNIILLPLIYLFIYIIILQNLRRVPSYFVVYGIILMQWIRFVLMPPVIIMAGSMPGMAYINPSEFTLNLAILLMIYELIFTSVFAFFWFTTRKKKLIFLSRDKDISFKGNKLIYSLFIILGIVLAITIGLNNNILNFAYIPIDETNQERIGDLTNTFLVLIRQIILISLFIIFLWTVHVAKKFYEKSSKSIYIDFAIIMALLNVIIIVGERRTVQIYTALVCIWILSKVFPYYKKRIIFNIGLVAFIVLFFMSVYKFLAAYTSGSYITAIGSADMDIFWWSRTLQSYFFGPENIAATIEFSKIYSSSGENLIFDITRSIFGLSFLAKGDGILTSAAFNTYIYGENRQTGHVISAIGYGTIYFGKILSPIIAVINIIIAAKIEEFMKISKSYEMMFVWCYILVRFATNLFVSTPPLLSYGSMMLGTAGLLFITAIGLKSKGNNKLL
ncbi:hypothetical protein [Salinicoccus halodurans]|uniref:Capsular biosynthesis protein n=1 Tax=Salinicoccus halodurans TaxID=407035 RepID=A0A0F7HK32_9STAP|nr:hypothetical protein [Salinicoccus halodurans]AKG73461.1 hypothetical protein AAT16_04070 [Salinicoccus halodurans]SFK50934.1 hypothetical protein SAMN05216235_0051 [Salinicoccus halodurans]